MTLDPKAKAVYSATITPLFYYETTFSGPAYWIISRTMYQNRLHHMSIEFHWGWCHLKDCYGLSHMRKWSEIFFAPCYSDLTFQHHLHRTLHHHPLHRNHNNISGRWHLWFLKLYYFCSLTPTASRVDLGSVLTRRQNWRVIHVSKAVTNTTSPQMSRSNYRVHNRLISRSNYFFCQIKFFPSPVLFNVKLRHKNIKTFMKRIYPKFIILLM